MDSTKKPSVGLHYSGYDHRPYDYATQPLDALDEDFKQCRFAHSLTNIHPRHYSTEEKDRLFTLEFAEHALAAGDISAPRDHTVLWSGGYIPGHPLGYGLGRIIAERWLTEKNKTLEASGKPYHEIKDQLYHTVAMTEAGLPVLNPMWDDPTVSAETKWKVTPTYIMGFARTARGEITLNVDDTDIDSFFRQHEIDVIMKNPDITTVRVVRVDPHTDKLVETVYPDRQSWYEDQKDQWVNSIITRYNLALDPDKDDALGQKLTCRMTSALVEEIYDSYKNLTQGNPLLVYNDEDAREASMDRERVRLKRFAPIISTHPEILEHEKISSEHARTALKQMFTNQSRSISPEDNLPQIVFLVGVSGSGKSTFRKEFVAANTDFSVLNIDEIRKAYQEKMGITFQQLFDPEHHAWSHAEFERQFKDAVNAGKNIIVDRVNLTPEDRERLLRFVPEKYTKIALCFPLEKQEIMARQKKRDARLVQMGEEPENIPEAVIDEMLARYTKPTPDEGFDVISKASDYAHCSQTSEKLRLGKN